MAIPQICRLFASHQFTTPLKGVFHVALHLIKPGFVDQRAEVNVFRQTITHGHAIDPVGKFLTEFIHHFLVNENPVGADTGLAAAPELVGDQVISSGIQVRIVKDNKRCITTQLQGQLLHLICRIQYQLAAHFGRAGEAEHGHVGAFAKHLADHTGLAHNQVDHAVWQVDVFVHQREQRNHRQRRLTGRLDHRRAPGRQGGRQLLGDHANGKVPGRDQAGNTNRAVVHCPGTVFRLFGNGMGVQRLNVFGAVIEEPGGVIDLTLSFLQRLAVLHAQNAAHFLFIGPECITNIFQPLATGFDGIGTG